MYGSGDPNTDRDRKALCAWCSIPDKIEYRKDNCFELAWCGQNILLSRMLIEDYILNGNKENLETAIGILDTRVKYCVSKNGLLASELRHFENLKNSSADTCNLGYGAYEFLKVYQLLKELGIEE